ncbi:MAG: right-handed parallel beta-helix repeat-containing protein [Verrucomicrobiales bacterium]|nr:right-handed parallel beta-helix repeat-containing protein [Verrucomicrobiales bacterium]
MTNTDALPFDLSQASLLELAASLGSGAATPQRPLIILPGIGGDFAATEFVEEWYVRRGLEPDKLQIDPLVGVYDDLIKTLLNVGYAQDQSLFVGNYDWRMTPGPDDGVIDGRFDGLTAASITDTTYRYGVDYLGYYLKKASDAWAATHGGARPADVDLVVHSTGGLVARAYIQSDAYGASTGSVALPRVHDLFMIGVPNRGASKAWNPLHDDWDVEIAFRVVLSKILARAWDRLQAGETITGPDGDITRAEVNAAADPKLTFALKYVPTMRGLLATYDFLDLGRRTPAGQPIYENVNASVSDRNSVLLDLNDGLDLFYTLDQLNASSDHTVTVGGRKRDPNAFIDRLTGDAVLMYSAGQTTPTKTLKKVGATGLGDEILTFTNFYGRLPNAGETWWQPIPEESAGDGTVPLVSSLGQFERDPNAKIKKFSLTLKDDREALDHLGIVWNSASQRIVLQELGIAFTDPQISKYSAAGDIESIVRVLSLGVLRPDELVKDAAINAVIRDALTTGMNAAKLWADKLEEAGPLADPIPVLGRSMGSILNFGGIVEALTQPIVSALANPAVTRVSQWVQAVRDFIDANRDNVVLKFLTDAHRVVGGVVSLADSDLAKALGLPAAQTDPTYSELLLQIPVHAQRKVRLPIDLGTEAAAFGVTAGIGLEVEVVVELKVELTLGFDLGSGVSADKRFFLRLGNLKATASVQAAGINAGINVGLLGAELVNGSARLAASLTGILRNPDGDARRNISLFELNNAPSNNFLTFQPRGSFQATLPLRARLGDFVVPGTPTLTLATETLFDGRGPRARLSEDFQRLFDFTAFDADDAIAMIDQFCDWLGAIRDSELLSARIPFVQSATFATVLDIKQGFLEIAQALRNPDGAPSFSNIQDLSRRLSVALGLPENSLQPVYDPAARTLVFRLEIRRAFTATGAFDQSTTLGDLAGFEGSAQSLTATGSVTLKLGLGFDLRPSIAVLQALQRGPSSGVLSRDAQFDLRVGSAAARLITVPANRTNGRDGTPANRSLDDLVADLNAVFAGEGLDALVGARRNGDRLEFFTRGAGQNAYLKVDALFAGAGLDELGFRTGQEGYQPAASRFFVLDDAAITGAVSFTVTDLNLSAVFGRTLEVAVRGGSGSLNASLSLGLKDPGATPDGRLTLSELSGGLANPATIVRVQLAGAANLRLPLEMNPPILNAPGTGTAALVVTWPDITRPETLSLRTENLDLIAGLSALGDRWVLIALQQVRDFLESLESTALNTPLPLVNRSVLDLLAIAEDIAARIDAFQRQPEATLQFVERKLEAAFGLPESAVTLSLVDARTLKIGLRLERLERLTLPVDLDLASLVAQLPAGDPARAFLSEVSRLVQVEGSGQVILQAGASLQIDLGLAFKAPTATSAAEVRPFLYDTTSLRIVAGAAVTNLHFRAAAGPVALEIAGGEAKIGRTCEPGDTAPAEFVLGLKKDPTDGLYYFAGDLGLEDVALTFTAGVCATLPVYAQILNTRELLGNLVFRIDRLADFVEGKPGSVVLSAPDLRGRAENFDFADNLELIIDGVDYLLAQIQNGLESEVFNRSLPLIGDGLANASREGVRFVEFLRTRILTELRSAFANATTRGVALVRQALFDAVGPGGLAILADTNRDGRLTVADVEAVTTSSGGLIEQIQFNLVLKKPVEIFRGAVGFDLGVPALGLEVDGQVDLGLDFELALRFGVHRQHGFYFDTTTANELKVRFTGSIPNLHAQGRLGFLQLDVTDSAAQPTSLDLRFEIDLRDPLPGTAETEKNRLTFQDLARSKLSQVLHAGFSGSANINLVLVTSFGGDANFPSLAADFTLSWSFTSADDFALRPPTVAFRNVRLNMGEFITRFSKGILGKIQEFIEPIRPVIEFLNEPIPGVSELLGRDYRVVDLLFEGVPGTERNGISVFVTQFVRIADLVNQLNAFSDTGGLWIPLGSFGFGRTDIRTVADLSRVLEQTEVLRALRERLPGLNVRIGELVESMADLGDTGSGITFPILDDPKIAFQLLLGKDVSLIEYHMAPLVFERQFEKAIPLLGPLMAYVSGRFKVEARLAFGYDTRGVRQFLESRNGLDLLNGLFMQDRLADGSDRREFTLDANLRIGVKVEAGAGRTGAEGGIQGSGYLDLRDPDHDGRVHTDEFIENLSLGSDLGRKFICTFEIGGTVTAFFRSYAELGVCPACIGADFRADKVLFDFASKDDDCFRDLFPDRFETTSVDRNGTRETATPIGVGPGQWLNGVAIGRPDDVDFYLLEVVRPEVVEARLAYARVRGDLNIVVTDEKGRLVARSQNVRTAAFEGDIAQLGKLNPGKYWVQIRGSVVASDYTLSVVPGPGSTTRVFYVNDATTADAYYTAGPGLATHDGLSPQRPKPDLASIFAAYDVEPTDILVLDTGAYSGRVEVPATDAGALITGSVGGSTWSHDTVALRFLGEGGEWITGLRFVGTTNSSVALEFASGDKARTVRQVSFDRVGLAVSAAAGPVVFESNTVSNARGGVALTGDATGVFRNNTLSLATGSGFRVATTSSQTLVFEGNTVRGIDGTGIEVTGAAAATLRKNILELRSGAGVLFSASGALTAEENRISGASTFGFRTSGTSAQTVLKKNQIDLFSGTGVHASASGEVILEDQQIQGASIQGVLVEGAATSRVVRNTIAVGGSADALVVLTGATEIGFNTLSGGTGQGIRVGPVATLATPIRANTIQFTRATDAIRIESRTPVAVELNTVGTATRYGIIITQSPAATVRGNVITLSGTAEGLHLDAGANRVEENRILGTGSAGIILGPAANAPILRNVVDLAGARLGIRLDTAEPVRIEDNTVGTASEYGIHLPNAVQSAVLRNTVTLGGNTAIGIRFEKGTGQVDDNTTRGTGQYGIYLSATVKLANATVRGNRLLAAASHSAIRLDAPDPVIISENLITRALTYGIYLPAATQATLERNTIQTGYNAVPIRVDAGVHLIRNNEVKVDASNAPGIFLAGTASGIVRDNLVVGGPIRVTSGDNVVEGNRVSGSRDGYNIRFLPDATGRISRNTLTGAGITVEGAVNILIEGNQITGAGRAVFLVRPLDSLLRGNLVLNSQSGFLVQSGRLVAEDNVIEFTNNQGIFYTATAAVSEVTLRRNTIRGLGLTQIGDYGVQVHGAGVTVVEDNVVAGDNYGISVFSSTSLRVRHNQVTSNYIGVFVSSPDQVTEGNTIMGTGTARTRGFGIDVEYVNIRNGAVIRDNSVTGFLEGIAIPSEVRLFGNRVFGNGTGIRDRGIVGVPGEAPNLVYDNDVGVETSNSGVVQFNHIYQNRIGVLVPGGRTVVMGNLIYGNREAGVHVRNTIVDVLGNTVDADSGAAILLNEFAGNVRIRNNLVTVGGTATALSITARSPSTIDSDYNLLHLRSAESLAGSWGGAPAKTLVDWRAVAKLDLNSATGDPAFANRAAADYTLLPGSPAIDRGDAWYAPRRDLVAEGRVDDGVTVNAGRNDYALVDQGRSLFNATGTAQNWRGNLTYWGSSLPFAFPYFDRQVTFINVTSEGFITFANSQTFRDADNSTAKLMGDALIAPLWDNLRTDGPGDDIFWDASQADRVTIRWNATNEADGSDVQFAVTLFRDGRIRFDYGPGNTALTPTVGFSLGNGFGYVLAPYNSQAAIGSASSLEWSLRPGFTDIGAREYRGGLAVGAGAGLQRSAVGVLEFPLSLPASTVLTASQIVLRNATTGLVIPTSSMALSYDLSRRVVHLTFPGLPGQRLAEGRYELVVPAAAINGSGSPVVSTDVRHRFSVLTGDATGDGVVNDRDLLRITTELRKPPAQRSLDLDLNGDARVDQADAQAVRTNYLRSLPVEVSGPTLLGARSRSGRIPWTLHALEP